MEGSTLKRTDPRHYGSYPMYVPSSEARYLSQPKKSGLFRSIKDQKRRRFPDAFYIPLEVPLSGFIKHGCRTPAITDTI
jgi:hypothetical protein